MTERIAVSCMIDRYWCPWELAWGGTSVKGILIAISAQTTEDSKEKLIPVGIVLLQDNEDNALNGSFCSVPMEFITVRT